MIYVNSTKRICTLVTTLCFFLLCYTPLFADQFFYMTEEVSTATTQQSRRIEVQPGDVATFTVTLTNLYDTPQPNATFETFFPIELKYVTGSLKINGEPAANVSEEHSAYGMGLRLSPLSIPSYQASPLILTFQAIVDSDKVLLYTNDCNISFPTEAMKNPGIAASSNTVYLSLPNTPMDYAFFELTEEVMTDISKAGPRADIQPGDIVTLTVTVRNLGDKASKAYCNIPPPKGLSYVPGSLLVNGESKDDCDFIEKKSFHFGTFLMPGYHQSGNPITLSYQALVDSNFSDETDDIGMATLQPLGEPVIQYMAISNFIRLQLR